jgi:hypothetical protein
MRHSLKGLGVLGVIGVLVLGCQSFTTDKEPAEAALKVAAKTIQMAKSDGGGYSADRIKTFEADLEGAVEKYERGDYPGALSDARAITSKSKELASAAAAQKRDFGKPTERAAGRERESLPQGPETATHDATVAQGNKDTLASEDQIAGSGRELRRPTAYGAPSKARQDTRQVQEALKNHGQHPGPIDGIMGPRTRQALREFQRANGLQQTGTVDDATMQRLAQHP